MFVSKLYSNLKEAYSKLNPATLSGAIDAIIVEQPDGTYLSSPFHVRFGKLGILQPKEREIDIEINGRSVDLRMILDDNGAAYFVPKDSEEAGGLSVSTNSLLNQASSNEDIADLMLEDAEDREVGQIFSSGAPLQVLSEPEQSPISSPIGYRSNSPSAKSDSEAPTNSLRWTGSDPPKMLSKGVFLDEITSGGEEMVPIYIGSGEREDDVESGRGVSMPQSPQPLATIQRVQEMLAPSTQSALVSSELCGEIAFSLCGPLVDINGEVSLEDFQQYRLSWEAFERDPLRHISNLDLFVWNIKAEASTIQAGQKIQCLPWSIYSAQLAAHCAFGRALPSERMAQLTTRCNSERVANGSSNSWFRSLMPSRRKPAATSSTSSTSTVTNDRALRAIVSSDNLLLASQTNGGELASPGSAKSTTPSTSTAPNSVSSSTSAVPASPTVTPNTPTGESAGAKAAIAPSVHSRLASDVRYATDDDEDEAMFAPKSSHLEDLNVRASAGKERRHPPARKRIFSTSKTRVGGSRRTRRLTTEQVKALELQPGENTFTFSLSHQLMGTTRLTCRVFVWKWDDRVIISDIDGTITRSDVLGQVLPIMGYEWTQPGVSRLFSLLRNNNYKILYLSARAIGLAQQTREYLCSIEGLPPGPLLLSPASLVNAFYKEVIERVPERFKINCLREIMKLFPPSHEPDLHPDGTEDESSAAPHTPFYAGFGNRPNDAKAYRAVLIPPSRIYIVNPRAEVRMDSAIAYKSTYDMLAESVDLFFPAYSKSSSPVHNQYNSFEFWRPKPDSL